MPYDTDSVIVVMGVTGCGKSTIAQMLAEHLQAHFIDADALHPASNIEKMSQGIPLSDADRIPWLETVCFEAKNHAAKKGAAVVACSALRRSYRDILNQAGEVRYVYLAGTFELIQTRVNSREGHFMPPSLLESQFATLEDPSDEPGVVTVDIDQTPEHIVASAVRQLSL